jgi:hypothetical protein
VFFLKSNKQDGYEVKYERKEKPEIGRTGETAPALERATRSPIPHEVPPARRQGARPAEPVFYWLLRLPWLARLETFCFFSRTFSDKV